LCAARFERGFDGDKYIERRPQFSLGISEIVAAQLDAAEGSPGTRDDERHFQCSRHLETVLSGSGGSGGGVGVKGTGGAGSGTGVEGVGGGTTGAAFTGRVSVQEPV
jgi:hypothetical protein